MGATVLVLLDSPTAEVAEVRQPVLELITAGRGLGARVDVVTLGAPSLEVLATLGRFGVSAVHQAQLPAVVPANSHRLTFVMSAVLVAAANRVHADLVLVPASFAAREAAAVAAARLGVGFVNNALTIRMASLAGSAEAVGAVGAAGSAGEAPNAAGFQVTSQAFGGSWNVQVVVATDPAVVVLQAGGVAAAPAAVATQPEVYPLPVEVPVPPVVVVSRELKPDVSAGRPALEDAAIVVAGGRGVAGDLGPVFELADALGAAVSVTRDVAFEGLFDNYIGTTGVTVAPSLYVACGISGAPYHTGGMRGSHYVVSINNDDDAPIRELSDLFIVGDLAAVLPAAAALLRERKAGGSAGG